MQTNGQTDRMTDRQTVRETDRQKDRQTEREHHHELRANGGGRAMHVKDNSPVQINKTTLTCNVSFDTIGELQHCFIRLHTDTQTHRHTHTHTDTNIIYRHCCCITTELTSLTRATSYVQVSQNYTVSQKTHQV